jgi:predicted RNase H-like nuclease (RuvC/YqgF family)
LHFFHTFIPYFGCVRKRPVSLAQAETKKHKKCRKELKKTRTALTAATGEASDQRFKNELLETNNRSLGAELAAASKRIAALDARCEASDASGR